MHIYTGSHSDITDIHYVHVYLQCNRRAIPLLSAFPFPIPFCSPFVSLYLLGTLLAVTGSCPPRSQVARKLIFPFLSPYPYTPRSKIPTPRGLPDPNIHSLGRHREPGSQDPVQLGPALHDMNDFQVTVPLIWSAVVQNLTFESA
jgi:hypothetical protein